MILKSITQDMVERAERLAAKMPDLKHSFMKGKGIPLGIVGQDVVCRHFRIELPVDTFNWDFLYNFLRYEVKSGFWPNVTPQTRHKVQVNINSTHQICDRFIFTKINPWTKCWILGWITREDFFANATHFLSGEYDEERHKSYDAECYSLAIMHLHDIGEL